MSYKYEQEIKGHTYVYEISSYWDKEKKQSRQKRVYLGKKDKFTGAVLKKKSSPIPMNSRSLGSIYFFKEIGKSLGLTKVLKNNFPEIYEEILYLSFFKIIQREAYYLYPLWCEDFYISEKHYMSSQTISDLLSEIGSNEFGVESFLAEWIRENKNGSTSVMFDITSISSYGSGNEFLEYGYNRDGENLNQINLGVLSQSLKKEDKSLELGLGCLPLGYRIYPGSITDVTSLKNIIKVSSEYDLNLKCFVLDKGFYSQANIKDLDCNGLSYVVPMSFSTSLSKELVKSLDKEITSPTSFFKFNGDTYFYCKKEVKVGYTKCTAHVYLDKKRRAAQESTMALKICNFEEKLVIKEFKSRTACENYLTETLQAQRKFFKILKKEGLFYIERDVESIVEETRKMGIIILLTPTVLNITRNEVLSLYRNKDAIEKIFDSLKNDIKEKRNRTHSLKNMRGSLFISFISLILISWMDHVMKEKKLYEKFTKSEVYKILNRLKVYKLANGTEVLGELSGRQKSIFYAFKVSKDIKPSYNF